MATLQTCSQLLCRMLQGFRWAVYDMQSASESGGGTTLCQRLCIAVQQTLSTLAQHGGALPGPLCTRGMQRALACTAGACFQILAHVGEALPQAVVDLLTQPSRAQAGNGVLRQSGPCWGLATLAAVNQACEGACHEYPATLAVVHAAEACAQRLPLSHNLASFVSDIVAGCGCQHAQWRWQQPMQRWELAQALVDMVTAAFGRQSPLALPCQLSLADNNDDLGSNSSAQHHSADAGTILGGLVQHLLQSGILSAFVQVRCCSGLLARTHIFHRHTLNRQELA